MNVFRGQILYSVSTMEILEISKVLFMSGETMDLINILREIKILKW